MRCQIHLMRGKLDFSNQMPDLCNDATYDIQATSTTWYSR